MSEEQNISAVQKAQIATRIGSVDQQIAQRETALRTLEQQRAAARGRKQAQFDTQISALREERAALLEETNTLRAQIGAPLIIGEATPPPTQTVVIQAPPKKKRGRGCLLLIGAVVVLIIGIGSLMGGGKSTASQTSNAAATSAIRTPGSSDASAPTKDAPSAADASAPVEDAQPAAEASAPTSAPLPAIGDNVQVGNVRWKVLEVSDEGQTLKGNDLTEDKSTVGKWFRLRLEVENLSKDQLQFSDVEIVDSQDRTFKHSDDFDVYLRVPEGERCSFLAQLNPNLPKSCTLFFELPADAQGLQAKVGDLVVFTSKEALIQLTP